MLRRFFDRLDRLEIVLIRRIVLGCQGRGARGTGRVVSRLGDGWIYLMVGVILPLLDGRHSLRPLGAASLGVGLAFLAYLPLKTCLARVRPCDLDPTLPCTVRTLDRYSCPSGHCMTATAVAVPLAWSYPALVPVLTGVALLIAWARLALGHHYPSDVAAGVLLGSGISVPVCVWLLGPL